MKHARSVIYKPLRWFALLCALTALPSHADEYSDTSQLVKANKFTEALAKVLGTHERRLSQAFQQHLGCSVYAWLREERLQQAHHLLATTQVPIATLSDVLGYSSPANFAKAFRERFDCTPRQVRQGLSDLPP